MWKQDVSDFTYLDLVVFKSTQPEVTVFSVKRQIQNKSFKFYYVLGKTQIQKFKQIWILHLFPFFQTVHYLI